MAMQAGTILTGTGTRSRASWMLLVALLSLALVAAWLPAGAAVAQVPAQVTGLTVEQHPGYATLSWDPVDGATRYLIERTPVDEDDAATADAVIVGLWRPDRTVTPESPAFADSGFDLGDRFQWRVFARQDPLGLPGAIIDAPIVLPTDQPSEAVSGTTLAPWGDPDVPGEDLRTEFELLHGAQWTSGTDEYAYTAAIDELSDRVRVVEIGQTILGRPINMFIIGYPSPPATAEEISSSPSVAFNCNVHGNESSSREACLTLARQLAFGDDDRTIDLLSNATVLIVPTINGDGRAANTRGNDTGQDLNRDHSLLRQPETFAFSEMLRDYTPEVVVDGHQGATQDLPILGPRHANVAESVYTEAKDGLIEGWLYGNAAPSGWWLGPYNSGGLGQETILRNTLGLKNMIGELQENRSSGGPTRPNANAQHTRLRMAYGALWHHHEVLDYHRANRPQIAQAIEEAVAFQTANTGRIVFRGSHPWPPYPHVGQNPPAEDAPSDDQILEDPPCGYLLTEEQYHGERTDGPEGFRTTVAERIEAHGWVDVEERPDGYLVPLAQPQRGLIPLLLDAQAAQPWLGAERVYEC